MRAGVWRAPARLALLLGLLATAISAGAASSSARTEDPVRISVNSPAVVAAKSRFVIRLRVDADADALGIAAGPLRLRAKLEPECGGSYAGTVGPKVVDRTIPAPQAGAGYNFKVRGRPRVKGLGSWTVCAFVEDAQERQFATSTSAVLTATKPCTKQTRRFKRLHRAARHAQGVRRAALRRRSRAANRQRRKACRVHQRAVDVP